MVGIVVRVGWGVTVHCLALGVVDALVLGDEEVELLLRVGD